MQPDFTGWATRANIRCADGRTIMPNAFKDNDGAKVPLVFQHGHADVNNVLGHVILENREEGVYARGFFNDTESAKHARKSVEHGDLDSMSIFANNLVERGGNVMHGVIREVSLVLSGANPEAKIDNVLLKHSSGLAEELDDTAVIYPGTGLTLKHSYEGDIMQDEDLTVGDILDTMTEEQQDVVDFLLATNGYDGEDDDYDDYDVYYDEDDYYDEDAELAQAYLGGNSIMGNIFETGGYMAHADLGAAREALNDTIAHATATGEGTLSEYLSHAIHNNAELMHAVGEDTDYGINSLEILFPEAKLLNGEKPEAIRRSQEWVNKVLSGVSKRPFSRIKMRYFNMTHEEARARGYIRGNMKKEMYWSMFQRTTEPTTIYQKEKIDRDDMIDITTVDVVAWMYQEMRVSLNEEIARAIMLGDGREIDDPDKIREDKIRPIAKEDDFYAHKIGLPKSIYSNPLKLVDAVFGMRKAYKGSGSPTFYAPERLITDLLLLRKKTVDGFEGERYWNDKAALARSLNVSDIVELDDYFFTNKDGSEADLLGIIVNLSDYAVGTDKGGEITSFNDFDIDYNQYKYLIEGRMSGALIKPKSAIVISKTSGSEITQSSPLYNPAPTHEPTVPVGAEYRSTGPLGGKKRLEGDKNNDGVVDDKDTKPTP